MIIPKNTVSPSMLRAYGTGDVLTDDHEESRGCPRRWKAKYVDGIKETETSYVLTYGSLFHRVMERIVAADVDPHEAVLDAIGPDVTVEMVDELLADLETYLARAGSDTDEMATLGTEVDLRIPLYTDVDAGEISLRVIIDWLGIDPDDPGTIHVKDYKSNRAPISLSDLAGDTQMRAYAWAVAQVASRWTDVPNPRVVIHMDLVKFRDYVYEYSPDEIDAWHTWATAMVRTILRDDEARPVINSYCSSCPVRDTCPAIASLPADALALTKAVPDEKDLAAGRQWRDRANAARLALEKVVKAWDLAFTKTLSQSGPVTLDGKTYALEPTERTTVDVFAIARILGDDFPKVATVSKAAIERSTLDESTKAQVLAQFRSEISGTRLTARKAQS